MELRLQFGGRLRVLRAVRGLTQDGLAVRCGLSVDTVRRLERGEINASLETVASVCDGLHVSLTTLFSGMDGTASTLDELADFLGRREEGEVRVVREVLGALFNASDRHGVLASERTADFFILEDDEDLARSLQGYFEDLGHAAHIEVDPARAVERLCHAAPPKLLLLDWVLPGSGGREVMEALEQAGRLPPTLILTAARIPAPPAGVIGVLQKPVGLMELRRAVHQALGEPQD